MQIIPILFIAFVLVVSCTEAGVTQYTEEKYVNTKHASGYTGEKLGTDYYVPENQIQETHLTNNNVDTTTISKHINLDQIVDENDEYGYQQKHHYDNESRSSDSSDSSSSSDESD